MVTYFTATQFGSTTVHCSQQ